MSKRSARAAKKEKGKPESLHPATRAALAAARLRAGFFAAVAASLLAYGLNSVLGMVSPAGPWGVAYGGTALALVVLAALYGLRKRLPRLASRLPAGAARHWLGLHVYGSLLFVLLMLMHMGFRLPTGMFNRSLFALALLTVASGLAGLALQRWIPRMLASGLSVEVLYERIPELITEIRRKADAIAAQCDEPIRMLYSRQVAPALAGPSRRFIYYVDITGGIQARLRDFRYLSRFLGEGELVRLEELERLYRAKLEIDAHYTLQQALRVWLWAHLPTSFLLLALALLHAAEAVYY